MSLSLGARNKIVPLKAHRGPSIVEVVLDDLFIRFAAFLGVWLGDTQGIATSSRVGHQSNRISLLLSEGQCRDGPTSLTFLDEMSATIISKPSAALKQPNSRPDLPLPTRIYATLACRPTGPQ